MQKFIIKINSAAAKISDKDEVQCYILKSDLPKEFIEKFRWEAKDKIILIEEDISLCKELDLDGAVVDLSKSENPGVETKKIKNILGDKFLGVISRNRRHEAMLISEQEPDFLIFKVWNDGIEKVRELLQWYSELFLIQSAVQPEDENLDFSSLPADIVIK